MKKTLQHSRVPSGTTSRSRSILNAESQNNMPDFGTWWQRLLSTASPSLYNVSVPTSSSSSTISTSSHDKNGRNKKQYKALQLDDFELDITPLNIEVPHDLDTSSHTHDNKQPSSNSSGSNASNTSTSMTNVILAWTSIVFAIIAGASIGPVFKYMAQHGIPPCLSASWRCQCMAVFLIPLAYMEATYYKCKPGNNGENPNHVDWFAYKPDLQFPVIVHIIISGIAWAGNLLLWIIALQYTTTFKASVITCSHPIMLTVYLYFLNMPVSLLEYLGVLVSFSGLILSSVQDLLENHQDPASTTLSDASNIDHTAAPHVDDAHEILGIILCLFSAACEVLVLFNRITTKKYVPLMQYTMATTVVVAILATVASLLLEGDQGIIPIPTNQYAPIVNGTFVSSNHHSHIEVFCLQEYCVFGWMSREWVGPILLFGLWIGVVCIAGFNYAMQYIAPLVFSALGLMDPAITAILSWLIGVETLPSIFSWVGGMIVMCGVGIISYGEHQRSIKEKDHEVINSQTSNYEEVQMLGDLEDSVHGPIFDGIRNDTSIEMMELPRASDEIDNEGDHSS